MPRAKVLPGTSADFGLSNMTAAAESPLLPQRPSVATPGVETLRVTRAWGGSEAGKHGGLGGLCGDAGRESELDSATASLVAGSLPGVTPTITGLSFGTTATG